LRLLLDEMHPAVVAEQLRARGHDVLAVVARPELRSLPNAAVFAVAQEERRTVVTENIGDFVGIADAADQRAGSYFGLVLLDPAKYPRGNKRTVGRIVTALDRLLRRHPDDLVTSLRHWL
jgi:hypothetical protein